ncbi:MAG: hypothetical protein Q9169_004422 [Polycauliona sp. 2 TL-2023]
MVFPRRWLPPLFERHVPVLCHGDWTNPRLKPAALIKHFTPATNANLQKPDPIADISSYLQKLGAATGIRITQILKQHYPDHVVVQTEKRGIMNLANDGIAKARLPADSDCYTKLTFSKRNSDQVGRIEETVELARFDYPWKGHHFKLYEASFCEWGYLDVNLLYVLCPKADARHVEGRSEVIEDLIIAAATHDNKIDNEIWVYGRGYWAKNRKLWKSVQSCKWDQVILNEQMKANLVADVEGFFDRKDDYKSFGVPWKRCPEIPTLYVKSLGKNADQDDVRTIFDKARDIAPCLLVFEDIDSLVSDRVKSFFLNEVDGLEGNDGVMMIGSTNYLDRPDAGIAKRPSRFDRKYHFALPAISERMRYCEHWRTKLAMTTAMKLGPEISSAIAKITEGFSFAYLQEALVTALLGLVQTQHLESSSTDRVELPSMDMTSNPIFASIKKQVEILRKEILDSRKSVEDAGKNSMLNDPHSGSASTAGFGLGRVFICGIASAAALYVSAKSNAHTIHDRDQTWPHSGNYSFVACSDDENSSLRTVLPALYQALQSGLKDAQSSRSQPSGAYNIFFKDSENAQFVADVIQNITMGSSMYPAGPNTNGSPTFICPKMGNMRVRKPDGTVGDTEVDINTAGSSIWQNQMWILFHELVHYYTYAQPNYVNFPNEAYNINHAWALSAADSLRNPENFVYYAATIEAKCRDWPTPLRDNEHELNAINPDDADMVGEDSGAAAGDSTTVSKVELNLSVPPEGEINF